MKTSAQRVLDEIEANPSAWVVSRNQQNYDGFLNLLLDLSYPSIHPSQIYAWRRRTQSSWALQDARIPRNCNGGTEEDGRIVASIGALPLSERILYVHTGTMCRTLKAAVSLFAATHCTFSVMETFPTIEYWMGIYTYPSRFVTTWQRPSSLTIPDQVEIEELRIYPLRIGSRGNRERLRLAPAVEAHFDCLSDIHRHFATMLMEPPRIFRDVYAVRVYSVVRQDESQAGIVLLGDAPDEFTAFNIFKWAFFIPPKDAGWEPSLIDELRGCELLRDRVLRVLTHTRSSSVELHIRDCQVVPAFIVLTPQSQLQSFRRSLAEAFCGVLDKYSESELEQLRSTNGRRLAASAGDHP